MSEPTTTNGPPRPSAPVPFLKRVRIRNYKSIAYCDVELGALTLLVGRNGSGKSNFLDALGFVAEALRTSLSGAITNRRAMPGDLWRRGIEGPRRLAVDFELILTGGRIGRYGLELSYDRSPGQSRISVARERLSVEAFGKRDYFSIRDERLFESNVSDLPPVTTHNLYLSRVAGISAFLDVFETLTAMNVYSLHPESMRNLRGTGNFVEPLSQDGSNIAGVFGRIGSERPEELERLKGYLTTIVPEIADVNRVELGPYETLEFVMNGPDPETRRKFYASSMSDGTLRALGTLVAVAQLAAGGNPVRLVGIEEPETALHPAAAGALMDALQEAAVRTQVVVTTHSPDLLDQIDPETDRLLAVEMRDGNTVIGPVNGASRKAIQEKLFSPGELLRMDQFQPDWHDLERQKGLLDSVRGSG